jgi:tetratricopeptide (TPR) repeat protein
MSNNLKLLDDSLGIINDNDNDSKDWDIISNITDYDDNDDGLSTNPIANNVINANRVDNDNDNENDNVDNEIILNGLANDANALVEAGDINQAIILYNDLMERYIIYYGPNHPSIVNISMILSDLYCNVGKFNDAFIFKEKGLRLQQKLIGQADPIFIDVLNSLIWMTYMAEDFLSMIKFFDEMLNYSRLFEIDNSEFAINMYNLIDQYENSGNIINLEQVIVILEYITEIIFMFRGNHDNNIIIVKENLAHKLKVQAELVYQRYQTIIKSSEWTDDEINDIVLIVENTIINNQIDEVFESNTTEFSSYLVDKKSIESKAATDDAVKVFTLDEILDEDLEENTFDNTIYSSSKKNDRSRQPYIRQNRTGLDDMQIILTGIL